MSVDVWILHESSLELRFLSSRERLERMLLKSGVPRVFSEVTPVAGENSVQLSGGFLYDQRIVKNIIDSVGVVMERWFCRRPRT